MAQAVIKFNEQQDRVVTIVKGKYGFKNKSDAVNFIIERFEEEHLEPELRPEYVQKIKTKQKEKGLRIGNISDFDKLMED